MSLPIVFFGDSGKSACTGSWEECGEAHYNQGIKGEIANGPFRLEIVDGSTCLSTGKKTMDFSLEVPS